ncbi:ParE family toxin-like protein [Klebsiella michiganensis]
MKSNFYLVIRLGLRWRLLSRNNGKHWYLMTHESYNKESKL